MNYKCMCTAEILFMKDKFYYEFLVSDKQEDMFSQSIKAQDSF